MTIREIYLITGAATREELLADLATAGLAETHDDSLAPVAGVSIAGPTRLVLTPGEYDSEGKEPTPPIYAVGYRARLRIQREDAVSLIAAITTEAANMAYNTAIATETGEGPHFAGGPLDPGPYDLATLKERKLSDIADACRAEYTSTLETSFGAPFHATEEAILDVMNIIARLEPEEVYPGYKGADDVWRDLTREQFQLALDEGANRKAACFAKRKLLTDQINAATTAAELDATTW